MSSSVKACHGWKRVHVCVWDAGKLRRKGLASVRKGYGRVAHPPPQRKYVAPRAVTEMSYNLVYTLGQHSYDPDCALFLKVSCIKSCLRRMAQSTRTPCVSVHAPAHVYVWARPCAVMCVCMYVHA